MRTYLTALLTLIILVLLTCTPSATAAEPDPVVRCSDVRISETQIRVTCTAQGVVLLSTVIDIPTVQLPPVTVTLPPPAQATIKVPVPGPPQATVTLPPVTVTETVRVPVPGAKSTRFVQVPGDTRTIREPGETITKTVRPEPKTVTQSALPQPTQTITVTPEARQDGTRGDTIDPDKERTIFRIPEVKLSPPEAAVLGLGTLALLAALVVLGMWFGYYMGYKDSDKAEAKFLKSLLKRQ